MDPVARSAAQHVAQQAHINALSSTSLQVLSDDMDQLLDEDESAVQHAPPVVQVFLVLFYF